MKKDDETVKIHYISVPSGMLAVYSESTANGYNMYYVQKDYLGSWLCLVNANTGDVLEQNFDAWGRTRNPAD